jgi:hypothetical protein
VVVEREGEPWTWTFHVRAFTEEKARRLIEPRLQGARFAVFACVPSDPLLKAAPLEEIVADYGPWRRSWTDPALAPLRKLLDA